MKKIWCNSDMNIEAKKSNFDKNLQEIRKKKGLTQAQLANITGLSRRMIGHYETMVKRPSLDNVIKIANALDVSIDELLGISKTSSKLKEPEISYNTMKKASVIDKLPVKDQEKIFSLINELAKKNKLKKDK
jgi:transcriptional regulator with XRE-family HTH domain